MKAKIVLREKAYSLRRKGYSYSEIAETLGVSKSSVSLWCRSIVISEKAQARISRIALQGTRRGRKKWADMRRSNKEETLRRIGVETREEVGQLTSRDRFIAGLMLYAGEGDKTQERIGMSNANPYILKFMLDWWFEFLGLDRQAFYAHLYLHVGLSEPRAKEFWSKALRIKKEQIKYVYRPIPRSSYKKNIHEFGVCSVRMHDISSHRRLMGWIRAVLDN